MKANPTLAGHAAAAFNRDNVDQRRLGELLDLFNSARFSRQGDHRARDLLGEVYEYFLGKFARAEGKRGGEFFTPPSVVRVLVEVLEPHQRPRLRPVLRLGRHVRPDREVHRRARRRPEEHLRLRPGAQRAHLADGEDEPRHPRHRHQGLGARWGDTFARDQHPDLADGLRHGQPAVQHQGLGPQRGRPALEVRRAARPATPTTPGSSTSSPSSRPAAGRRRHGQRLDVLELQRRGRDPRADRRGRPGLLHGRAADPAVPQHRHPGLRVVLRQGQDRRASTARSTAPAQVLFIDARNLGYMVDRAERALSDEDIAQIADTYHAWRGTPSAAERA